MKTGLITGFSKLSRDEKRAVISSSLSEGNDFLADLESLSHTNPATQAGIEQFSENTLGNFPLPFGVAPNFLINGSLYTVPMVTEESSVVAAASFAARFWSENGGFHAKVLGTRKAGQVHFCWHGNKETLLNSMDALKVLIHESTRDITGNMEKRGGGIKEIELIDYSSQFEDYYQLLIGFETADSMGANFINTVLEQVAKVMEDFYGTGNFRHTTHGNSPLEIIMAILSNYTPGCIVEVYVETDLNSLGKIAGGLSGEEFARKFKMAVDIANIDPNRAVTHNKGIFNGIDAVVIATANDFRAVEAAGHAWAGRFGKYASLSDVKISDKMFRMNLEIPLAVGTVGGLTNLHPIARWSFEILKKPSARELMMIIASAGLASNFSAVRSLVTGGIQKGHMRMHLGNILSQLGAEAEEKAKATAYFRTHAVSASEVQKFLEKIRNEK